MTPQQKKWLSIGIIALAAAGAAVIAWQKYRADHSTNGLVSGNGRVEAVEIDVAAKVVIDATGDANAARLAGCKVTQPTPCQPGTLVMRCGGYNLDALDGDAIDAAARTAIEAGQLRWTDVGWRRDGAMGFLRSKGGNCNHIVTEGCQTSAGKTAA